MSAVDQVRNHQGPVEEGRPLAPMTMQAMRGGGDIYDIASYVKHAGGGGEGGRRPGYRGRPRVRPGLDKYRRIPFDTFLIPSTRPGRPMFHHQGPGPLAEGSQGLSLPIQGMPPMPVLGP